MRAGRPLYNLSIMDGLRSTAALISGTRVGKSAPSSQVRKGNKVQLCLFSQTAKPLASPDSQGMNEGKANSNTQGGGTGQDTIYKI